MPSSTNFNKNIIKVICKDMVKEINIFMFAINADARKQKNNGLVNSVNFEFDDQRTL